MDEQMQEAVGTSAAPMEAADDGVLTLTASELAERLNSESLVVAGLLKFLTSKQIVRVSGQRPAKNGRGKPANVYAIPRSVTLTF